MNTDGYWIPCVALAGSCPPHRGARCRGRHPWNPGSTRFSGKDEEATKCPLLELSCRTLPRGRSAWLERQ